MSLLFGVYALAIAPWLEPPAVATAKYDPEKNQYTPSVTLRTFDDLFDEGSWELDDPKVIETASCTVLLNDYKPLPDGRMEVNPCTLIFYMAPTAKQPERRRVVMRALK